MATNRLSREKSPYLLQHQHNPVDWFPWGDEAFTKARELDRPIFLSIGYSTCHWCHVMERESFENEKIAEALNSDFVSIKVDREERPDVDRIYMSFVQATTGHGGWPLNVFLTPDLKPFFGGTYWPPQSRRGQAAFPDVLGRVADAWRTRRAEIARSADSIHSQLSAVACAAAAAGEPEPAALDKAAHLFKSAFDAVHGGFGGAPKFPQPGVPMFLMRHARRTGDTEALQMVLHTCDKMAAGGIYDQLGGGFARYSVDAEWLVPHFEKMLYDNAQLAHLYMDAWAAGHKRHEAVVRGVLDYVLREMTHPAGGFFSAEDADSEGHEGKFYCWTRTELDRLLEPDEASAAARHFGITDAGNFVDHSHPTPLPNQNVLSIARPAVEDAEREILARARKKMFDARAARVRPHLDDKVLASWNGLMLGALARAGIMLGEPGYLEAAGRNATFIRDNLWHGGRLYHRWRDGQRDNRELLEGSAFMLDGLLHLYEATLDPGRLQFAIEVAGGMMDRFYDAGQGGFWQAPPCADLILRMKPDYDGAEPCGNSVAVLSLLRLGKITGTTRFIDAAERTLRFFAERLTTAPHVMTWMLQALEFHLSEPTRLVFAGKASVEREALLRAAHSVFHPNKVILGAGGSVDSFARSLESSGPARVFLCTGSECKPPIENAEELAEALR